VLRTPVFALGTARRGRWTTFVLRTPVFALGTARRGRWTTFVLRTPVFALGTARRAHGSFLSARPISQRYVANGNRALATCRNSLRPNERASATCRKSLCADWRSRFQSAP